MDQKKRFLSKRRFWLGMISKYGMIACALKASHKQPAQKDKVKYVSSKDAKIF